MLYQAQMRNFIRLVLIALLGSSLASCSTWVSDDFADSAALTRKMLCRSL